MKRINSKRIVVHLQGGIGNQLFQFSFGEYLKINYGLQVIYDISTFDILGPERDFQIDLIRDRIPVFETNKYFFSRHRKFMKRGMRLLFRLKPGVRYYNDLFSEKIVSSTKWNLIYFDGYWQNKMYAEWLIKNDQNFFVPLNQFPEELNKYLEFIKHNTVTSIHIRRGDYLLSSNKNTIGVCSLNYYNKAADYILSKDPDTKFLVFSDDIDWVKKNLKLHSSCVYVEEHDIKSIWYIFLMSKCKNNIMSNSTFSWWGNFLNSNSNKITVAPLHWMRKGKNPDIYADNWFLIDNWV